MKNLLSLILSISLFSAIGQINPKTKWGQVSQEEIDYKEVSFEKWAPAVILYEEGYTSISKSFQTHIYRRIKILSEKGIEAANQELVYYSYKALEGLGSIKAQTINIENGKPVIYPVNKNEIYDTNLNEYYNSKKFTFPNVHVGSIIELEYDFSDQKLYFIDAWRFQHEFPTLYSSYEIKNNTTLDYTTLMIGDKIVEYSKNKKSPNSWVLTSLPSYTSLNFLYNPKDMAERIALQLRGYSKAGGSYGSTSHYEDVLSDWKALNQEMETLFNNFTSKSVGSEIASAIPNGNNDKETLENVYQYFRQNYKWNHFYGISAKTSNRKLEKTKSGNSTDLNLLLNSILNAKSFKTELILLSSRENGKIITSYPYLGQFNYVVNLVSFDDGSSYLIDASNMDFDLGYAPLRDYNHYALIIDPKNERFVTLTPPVSVFENLQVYSIKDGKYVLMRTDKKNGYFKKNKINQQEGITENSPVKNAADILTNETQRLEKDAEENNLQLSRIISESAPISEISFIGIENPLKDIISRYKLEDRTRERALEFNFPFHYKTDVLIDIPEGYKAEIPQGFGVHNRTSSNDIVYYQKAEIKEGKVVLHYEFYLGKSVFNQNYADIKALFDKSNLDASKAILLKKN